MKLQMRKSDVLQIIKFGMVGSVSTLLDYGSFFVFFSLLNFDKNLAQVFATGISMINAFLMNRHWTFRKSGAIQGREVMRFIVVNLLSLGVTLLCLNLFHDIIFLHDLVNKLLAGVGIPFAFTGDLGVLLCKLTATPFSWAVNFFGNRLWVFGEKK